MIRKQKIKKNLKKIPLKIRKKRRIKQIVSIYLSSPLVKEHFEKIIIDSAIYGYVEVEKPSFMDILKSIQYKLTMEEYNRAMLIAKKDEQNS